MSDVIILLLGNAWCIGRLTPPGETPVYLLDPAQVVPMPIPVAGGGLSMGWVVMPLPVARLVLPAGTAPYPGGDAESIMVQQYTAQLAEIKARKAGLSLPDGRGPRRP